MKGLSVVIPTLDAAATLSACLEAIAGCAVIVADGGSGDATIAIAERGGARVVRADRGRGPQLIAGAALAPSDWLLFLHADTVLEAGWRAEVGTFVAEADNAKRAAVFAFALDDGSPQARRLERLVRWRGRALGLPYGDQGLLIHRRLYDAIGGYRPLAIMEDVDLVRRIGRARLVELDTRAVTNGKRWRREGWLRRSGRNIGCLALYFAGVPSRYLVRLYG